METCDRCERAASFSFAIDFDGEPETVRVCAGCTITAVLVLNALEVGLPIRKLRTIAKVDFDSEVVHAST